MSTERVTVPCLKCGQPVSPGACAGEPLVYHNKAEHCREALQAALAAAESSAAEWRALAVGLVEALPRCHSRDCLSAATRSDDFARGPTYWCDGHAADCGDAPWTAPLRAIAAKIAKEAWSAQDAGTGSVSLRSSAKQRGQ